MRHDEEFRSFAESRQAQLLRSAYLLCGDFHTAQDLVQTAFGQLYRGWRHMRRAEFPDAYAKQVLYRCYAADRRRKRVATVALDLVGEAADRSGGDPAAVHGTRAALFEALALLPPKCRAVVVLRFWEDYSVTQTADALGISEGTVKSQTSRALGLLRGHLAEATFDR
ncbi:SigE family RNA polymerase sigma factor [Catenulispora yoronensis]|uniref:SigE family RNA polymerase sigma factor n=1 Tax=Catenulispora yoronensis TaxID=450799 RepID=A0ABN2UWL5_9ACTN